VILAGSPSSGVIRSTDQGASWGPLTGLPTANVDFVTIAISKSNGNRAYVLIAKPSVTNDTVRNGQVNGIFRTDNLLSTVPAWTDITPTETFPDGHPFTEFMFGQGWYHNAIEVHPTDPDLVFAGGGTMIKSTDAGATWLDFPVPHADIKVISYRTTDNLLYVAGDGGIYTSTDDGSTWSTALNQILPTTMFYNIDVSKTADAVVFGASQDNATSGTRPSNRMKWFRTNCCDGIDVAINSAGPSIVLGSNQSGRVHRSTTGGDDCDQAPWVNSAVEGTRWSTYIVQAPNDTNWMYYNAPSAVQLSVSKGINWFSTFDSVLPGSIKHFDVSSDGYHIYVVTDDASRKIERYEATLTPPTVTWVRSVLSSGPTGAPPNRIVTSMTAPGRAYALNPFTWTSRVFRTTDFGASWQSITGDLPRGLVPSDILESPSNPDILWLATTQGVYKSIDGGVRWWWWNRGMPDGIEVNDLEYAFAPGGDYVVAGTFGRSAYERNVDAGVLSLLEYGLSPLSIAGAAGLLFSSGDSGRTGRSFDAGRTWEVLQTPVDVQLYSGSALSTERYLAVGEAGTIVRTSDGGLNWAVLNSPVQTALRALYFIDSTRGFAAGAGGMIIGTTDGGETWQPTGNGFAGTIHAIDFRNALDGFAAGVDTGGQSPVRILLRTTDGGTTWIPDQNLAVPGRFNDIFFADSLTGYLALDDGSMLKTKNGGTEWNPVTTNLQAPLYACHFINPDSGWAAGSGGALIRTSDGGASWTLDETETQSDIRDLFYADGSLLAATPGGLMAQSVDRPVATAYEVKNRWNLVSLPLGVEDASTASLFPSATSSAYAYEGQYVPGDTLEAGRGYWLKFDGDETVMLTGFPMASTWVEVSEGWNLVGSAFSTIPTAGIITAPEGLIATPFYGYENGYAAAAALEPSRGYWVKAAVDGHILLGPGSIRLSDTAAAPVDTLLFSLYELENSLNSITIEDAGGRRQRLYFSLFQETESLLGRGELPPSPPAGAFDVRFGTGRMIEAGDSSAGRFLTIQLSSALYPVTMRWDVRQVGPVPELRIGNRSIPMSPGGSVQFPGESNSIGIALKPSSPPPVPAEFTLGQNYPNPFNPQTVIPYGLPVESRVRIVVYDALGRLVKVIAEGVKPAGVGQAEWDATGMAGGVYFCRMEAAGVADPSRAFMEVTKMVVMK
jgi:photosystem II stability/assembly factor-like uncharacterized protein